MAHGSRDYERESSKSREKEREKGRDKEKDRDRDRERERDRDRDRGEARTKIGKGTGTEIGIGIGTEIEKEKGLETGIVIVIIGTATGIAREVSGGEIRTMTMMITTVSGTLIGGGIMTETGRIGIDASLGLVRGVDLSTNPDRGHVLVHAQKGFLIDQIIGFKLSLVYYICSWYPDINSCSKRISGFDMAPPASAMLAGAAVAAAVWKVRIQLMKAMLGYLPHCDDNGCEPTSVALCTRRNQCTDYIKLKGKFLGLVRPFLDVPEHQFGSLPVMPVQAMTQQATRHARRVYVGGFLLQQTNSHATKRIKKYGFTPNVQCVLMCHRLQSVATFFSQVMAAIGGNTAAPGDAVVNVYINHEKKFAFVEMRSVEEASNAMALDGIIFEGAPVKVRRPSDYNPSLAATLGPSQPSPNLNLAAVGLTPGSAGGLEGPDRIFVDQGVAGILRPLRGFDLVKDRETGNSKGYAFCVYQDLSVTDIACAALNGIKMGDKTLTVRRANQGANQPKPEQESVLLHAQQQIALQRFMLLQPPSSVATRVVCLTQVVTADELRDDDEYEDILEDMRLEGGKFGPLVNVIIPRPRPDGEPLPGVGKVFLEYADVDGSTKARTGLNGRKFGGNQVVAVFYPEDKFAQGDYEG
ncbi:U2 snRNP auxilliary factor, large subunit, splicing factor [Prunus dulcis]|uniref:U2 snRNP auxilliary factor, large subunit, splicing factor n=1 Tax=Prunus dulcis TaxID=3755 RepID=A0A4Y1RU69_PRUDU|nr:U2 snRNP auxilliary factor, large subunit, splicing factor [Prunus dulcis]